MEHNFKVNWLTRPEFHIYIYTHCGLHGSCLISDASLTPLMHDDLDNATSHEISPACDLSSNLWPGSCWLAVSAAGLVTGAVAHRPGARGVADH